MSNTILLYLFFSVVAFYLFPNIITSAILSLFAALTILFLVIPFILKVILVFLIGGAILSLFKKK